MGRSVGAGQSPTAFSDRKVRATVSPVQPVGGGRVTKAGRPARLAGDILGGLPAVPSSSTGDDLGPWAVEFVRKLATASGRTVRYASVALSVDDQWPGHRRNHVEATIETVGLYFRRGSESGSFGLRTRDRGPRLADSVREASRGPALVVVGRLALGAQPGRSSAARIAAGHAFVQNLRRGHYELATDTAPPLRLATAFTELALAM